MSFLSRIFGKKEEKVELSMKQLPKWVEKRASTRLENINNDIEKHLSRISDYIPKTNEALDKLANAELQNPKMITRAKQIMAGNREAYVKKVNLFLEMVSVPEKITISSIRMYLDDYDRAIKELTKSSARSYYVVAEFFGNEVGAVARIIKDIDNVMKKIEEIVNDNEEAISKILSTKTALSDIQTGKQRVTELKCEIVSLDEEKANINKEVKQVESRMSSLKKSKGYSDYNALLKSEQQMQEELQNVKHNMLSQMAVLDRALRKYSKVTLQEKLVISYLEKPLKSILDDNDLKLVGVLNQLKSAIESGEVELKDKKKEKSLAQIGKLTRNYLSEFRAKHEKLEADIKQSKDLIKNNSANLELKELEYKLDYLNTRLNNADRKQKQIHEELEKLNVDRTQEILQNIQDVFGVEVVLN